MDWPNIRMGHFVHIHIIKWSSFFWFCFRWAIIIVIIIIVSESQQRRTTNDEEEGKMKYIMGFYKFSFLILLAN